MRHRLAATVSVATQEQRTARPDGVGHAAPRPSPCYRTGRPPSRPQGRTRLAHGRCRLRRRPVPPGGTGGLPQYCPGFWVKYRDRGVKRSSSKERGMSDASNRSNARVARDGLRQQVGPRPAALAGATAPALGPPQPRTCRPATSSSPTCWPSSTPPSARSAPSRTSARPARPGVTSPSTASPRAPSPTSSASPTRPCSSRSSPTCSARPARRGLTAPADLPESIRQVLAVDGSFFALAADVAWALRHGTNAGQAQGRRPARRPSRRGHRAAPGRQRPRRRHQRAGLGHARDRPGGRPRLRPRHLRLRPDRRHLDCPRRRPRLRDADARTRARGARSSIARRGPAADGDGIGPRG